jgi:hypothetical protein
MARRQVPGSTCYRHQVFSTSQLLKPTHQVLQTRPPA